MENCEDNTYEAVVQNPINALTYWKFDDEIDAINFTGQSFQSEGVKYALPQIEIKCQYDVHNCPCHEKDLCHSHLLMVVQ